MTDLMTRAIVGTRFEYRQRDLIAEGYQVIFTHCDEYGVFTKLRHRNGNIVVLTCDYGKQCITQKTNGEIVHQEKVCQP